jgi:preprotein translocase subunit YajC
VRSGTGAPTYRPSYEAAVVDALAVLAVAFYFLLIRPQRMRSKKAQDLMGSLKRGDEIVTIGGFFGRIKDVREDSIIITIAGGVDVKVAKSAISKVVTSQGSVDTQNKM